MLDLVLLPEEYAVCRLDAGVALPTGLAGGPGVFSVTWTPTETSVICTADRVPPGATANAPWRCFQISGPLNLAMTGILASLLNPLADSRVNIFAFSTYDTDYVLVPSVRLGEALAALVAAGHRVERPAASDVVGS